MKTLKLFGFALLALSLSFTACKKDETTTTNTDPGHVHLNFSHNWYDEAFALNTEFVTNMNQNVQVSKFRYYVSNVVLTKTDGSTYSVPESYYLVDFAQPESWEVMLDDVPAGTYNKVQFLLGVDSTRNVSGAQTGALDPANDMFWSWNSGYIFLKLEGTSIQSPDSTLTFHIGGFREPNVASRSISLTLPSEITVNGASHPEVNYLVRVKKFFHGVEFASTYRIHMPGAAASSMADNASGMFSITSVN